MCNYGNATPALALPRLLYLADVPVELPRKGFDLLLSALHLLPESLRKRSLMLVLGHTDPALLRQVNLETVSLGFVTETEKKVLTYGAADVFTFPTRADNLPLVLQERMACGTSMVSFAVGGVPIWFATTKPVSPRHLGTLKSSRNG